MNKRRLIDAVQSSQGDYENLSKLLNCYDVWSASEALGSCECRRWTDGRGES